LGADHARQEPFAGLLPDRTPLPAAFEEHSLAAPAGDAGAWLAQIETAPDAAGVFAILAAEGMPYLARTSRLRWRLKRLLSGTSRFSLLPVAREIRYQAAGSRLETAWVHYRWARRYFPDDWNRRIRLRPPSFVKLIQSNPYPRTQVTARLTGGKARWFGPFRTRASAELFESQMLDLFQLRRCTEDLAPSPEHPGCIYGEMALCLRPCQEAVSADQYATEAARISDFFRSGGVSLRDAVAASRDRASEQMEFELAARQHTRLEKVDQVLKLRDELASDLDALTGVAVLPSAAAGHVQLQFVAAGWFQPLIAFSLAGSSPAGSSPTGLSPAGLSPAGLSMESAGQSMDARLRQLVPAAVLGPASERQDHVSILSAWFYSTWRDGEWVAAPSLAAVPYRKLVNAIARVARAAVS
jgi:hypothetical protein